MSAIVPDYDNDPERSRSFQAAWQEDVHAPVADRVTSEGMGRVLDVGCGVGRFAAAVRGRVGWIGVDRSRRQVADCSYRPICIADAMCLPFAAQSVDAIAMLWMLYHLADPLAALTEAKRVLRPGGLLASCASSRRNDPELVPDGYPRTTFDAEEAPDLVAAVFGGAGVEVERWDGPMVRLGDQSEVAAYARSHLLPVSVADAVDPPLTLTKRGCLVWARRS